MLVSILVATCCAERAERARLAESDKLVTECNCTCGECEAGLVRERFAWQAERASLESQLIQLRNQLEYMESEVQQHGRAQSQRAAVDATPYPGVPPPDRPAAGLGVRVSSTTDQVGSALAPHGASRTLLQTELEPQCAIGELLAVMDDPIATVTTLFTTNVGCAMCLVPCASADDAFSCLMGCLKRDEGSCAEEDLAAIEASGMPSSLAGRAQLVRMMEVTTRGCVRCIVETIASVCGGDCVPERLHIVTDYAYNPRPCLPELARRISIGEASAFERAVAANEPFGLVIGELPGLPKLSDLFVPLDGPPQQRKV
jgi:hypothetical protein